ncbi:MAG: tRNA-uridine aminocarboxypropyltransferase [Parashewanella sp.]
MAILKHCIHELYEYRKSLSTTSFNARGKNISRCNSCLQARTWCLCEHRRQLVSNASFVLLMYDDEVLKPSNSGRLIADLIPDTHAFLWSRVEVDPKVIALINHDDYQPIVIFPDSYNFNNRPSFSTVQAVDAIANKATNKKPLFILLDGCWREAAKMFRKSPYLNELPLLSFSPDFLANYAIRKGQREFQLGTAEVAALALESFGEHANAKALIAWTEVFKESILLGRNKRVSNTISPFSQYTDRFAALHQQAIEAMVF